MKISLVYFVENRIGTQNIGNVLGQLLLCKQFNPDFHAEELNSITKDSKEIAKLLAEMQEFLPRQEAYLGGWGWSWFMLVEVDLELK
jgi:hypothetical protein